MGATEPCRLCGKVKPLRLSHISPKFVFRFQKNTSPAIIRSHLNPNRPAQDSRKIRFLCGECEERFNPWETTFKQQIYDPYHAGTLVDLQYGSWLLKFAASISWRALSATLEDGGDRIPASVRQEGVKAETVWREYLLDEREHPDKFPQYLFLLEPLANSSDQDLPINFSFYVQRVAASGIRHDPRRRCIFTFGMLCSIAVVGLVYARSRRSWGERLRVRQGKLLVNDRVPPPEVVDMIKAQANDHLAMSRQLTERQKTHDREKLLASEEAFFASGYARAMALDVVRGAAKRN